MNTSYETSMGVIRTLRQKGFEAYWAGGCVRDLLLGQPPNDYDIATNAPPHQVQRLFPKTQSVGAAFGVIKVLLDGEDVEIATFRSDHAYTDGRHPEGVSFTTAKQDALRRDFTINGLFFDPVTQHVLDYVGGLDDLKRKRIRSIGSPFKRFEEDFLRMLRAVRFASVLGFEIEEQTQEAIKKNAAAVRHISAERIRDEITTLLIRSPKAGSGLIKLHELGLLRVVLPEVADLAEQEQPPAFHPEGDVLTHTALMLDGMDKPSRVLAFSVLLHDVGKPATAELTQEPDGSQRIRFNGHARVGAEMSDTILKRLKFPNREREAIIQCVRDHMRFIDVQKMKPSKLRCWLAQRTFETELELHRLDCLSSHGNLDNYVFVKAHRLRKSTYMPLPKAWITGHDLLALGLSEGPQVGRWITAAYEAQLEGRLTSRKEALAWISQRVTEQT